MIYKPFSNVNEVKEFFGHSIYMSGSELTVVGANLNEKSKNLYIQAVNEGGEEFSMNAMDWFYSATYMGHNFGKRVAYDF